MTNDISNFYLMTPLHRPEFIRMKLSDIPDEVIEEYELQEKATKNGSIYIKAKKALKQFQRIAGKLQHSPYPSVPIQYGAKKQYATQELTAPLLDDKAKCFIQQVCRKFLFLGRAVDSTLLCPISTIASQSSKPTTDMIQQTLQLLDYLATQENAVLSYHASDMVLAVKKNSFAAAASAAAAAAAATATAVVVFVDSGLIIVIAVDCHCPRRRRCCHFCCHRRCSLL